MWKNQPQLLFNKKKRNENKFDYVQQVMKGNN